MEKFLGEEDVEKEVNNWKHQHFHGRRDKDASGEYLERTSQLDLARHFANWQKERMLKDALELKEVDLEKEIEEVKHNYKVDDNRHTSICSADIEWLANHFFELGLKTQKRE